MSESNKNEITFRYSNTLDSRFWDDGKLDRNVRESLLEAAADFLDTLGLELEVDDITLTGSIANYNYTKYSDFDLHIITDYALLDIDSDILKDYFKAKSAMWNGTRNVTIKGHKVEVYIQNSTEPHFSSGVYSLKDDTWFKKPTYTKSVEDIDPKEIEAKKQSMLDIINFALTDDCDVECAEKAKARFLKIRGAALEKDGEYSIANLAFKELRRSGDIYRLIKGVLAKKDKELSLDSNDPTLKETLNFKSFLGLNKRGPRHQQIGAGLNKLGDPEKSLSIVADMHKKKKTDTMQVHKFRKKEGGHSILSDAQALKIINQYGLSVERIKSGQEKRLSTGDTKIGFNKHTNTFYMSK